MSLGLHYYISSLICHYLHHDQQSTLIRGINKKFLFYMEVSFYIHLKTNISNLYNLDRNLILTSQPICDHMFSYPKLDYMCHVFLLRSWLIFLFFSHVAIYHSIQIQEGVESILSWFLIESNWLNPEYYYPLNNDLNLKYCLAKYYENRTNQSGN